MQSPDKNSAKNDQNLEKNAKNLLYFPQFFNFGLLGSGKNCLGLRKNYYGLARVLQNIARVGSGWAKHPRVGSNLGSGFDPTHPYRILHFNSIV